MNPKRVVNGWLSRSKGKARLSPQSAAVARVSLSIREPSCHLYNMSGRLQVKFILGKCFCKNIQHSYFNIVQKIRSCRENDQVRAKLRRAAAGEVD